MASEKKEYTLEDIFFIAMKIEKNGAEFYRILMERARNGRVRKLLEHLAMEEEGHRKIFKGLSQQVAATVNDRSSNLYEKLFELAALADTHIFLQAKTAEAVAKMRSEQEFIAFAMQCEDETIRLFEELITIVDDVYRPALEALIKEEEGHKAKLQELKGVS